MLKISFRTDAEQGTIIKSLRLKGIKLIEIHEELVHAFGEESYTLASVKH
jgi:hypothetical protein